MDFNLKISNPKKQKNSCAIMGVFEAKKLSEAAKIIDEISKGYLSKILNYGDLNGYIGQMLLLHDVPNIAPKRILLIGCGKEEELTCPKYQTIITNSIKSLNTTGSTECINYLTELNVKGRAPFWNIKQSVLITEHILYKFNELKTKKHKKNTLGKITFTISKNVSLSKGKKTLREAVAIANGIKLTRDLANRPSNICTPTHLAQQAINLSKSYKRLNTDILEENDMKKLGMNSLLSVSQGSIEPAKLITIKYNGLKKAEKPIVLVGKGVTFDTGGISIKPSQAMDEMKYDMCGAASVLGTMLTVAKLNLPINVIGVIPTVENMPSGSATKPGDIFTSLSGKTIEVLNTDAEGRLILCDALSYCEQFNPDVVIDIATLTGACVIALGKHASGLLSNCDPLAKDLLNAGDESGDRAWQLPLWDVYQKQLYSPFADIANIGGREAGTITAACFLSNFTKKYKWAHLDIAGTSWGANKNKEATGRPVPLLTQYILNKAS